MEKSNVHLRLLKSNSGINSTGPQTLEEFVGQPRVKGFVIEMASGARAMNAQIQSLLLVGPSGGGKTLLARLISTEISGQAPSVIIATPELTRNDLACELRDRKSGQFIYIDEAQSLSRSAQELLFCYMDSGVIPQPGENRPNALCNLRVHKAPLIFSTNNPGALRKELRSRLTVVELDDYTDDDLGAMVLQLLGSSFEIEPEALSEIVTASHGSPRAVLNCVRELILISQGSSHLTKSHVERLCELKDIGPKGLPKISHQYLRFLSTQPDFRARLSVIADRFGLDSTYVRKEIEPILHRHGYINVSPHGRILSQHGRKYAQRHFVSTQETSNGEGC